MSNSTEKTKFEIFEAGNLFATIEAENAEEALDLAEEEYPRHRSAYNVEPGDAPSEVEWYARRHDDSATGASRLVSVPAGQDHEDKERLARAAAHVEAADLGDGNWAHYADETSRWYVVSADELAELCDYLDSDDEQVSRDAYSHWCAGTSGEEMPEGWEPSDNN